MCEHTLKGYHYLSNLDDAAPCRDLRLALSSRRKMPTLYLTPPMGDNYYSIYNPKKSPRGLSEEDNLFCNLGWAGAVGCRGNVFKGNFGDGN